MKKALKYIGLPNASEYICIENGLNKDFKKTKLNSNKTNKKLNLPILEEKTQVKDLI